MNRTTLLGVLAAAVTTLALAGCGGAGTNAPATTGGAASSAATATAYNDADITFATDMVPHHAQAIDMAKLAATTASSARVKDLAAKIEQAQGPEITQLQGFLAAWGQPAASSSGTGDMGGMPGMGGDAMPGMMTDQQMQQLTSTSGKAFDRMWLQMMIDHHNGAIDMARTELGAGTDTDAKALAQKIINAQQGEITTMTSLLTSV